MIKELCCCYRHAGGGDSVAVGNALLRTQNCTGTVSVQNKQYCATEVKRLNKAATVIQVCISGHHAL